MLISPDAVAPSRMVSVTASVNLLLHHKVQKKISSSGTILSTTQEIGWEEHLQNDLFCVELDVKP